MQSSERGERAHAMFLRHQDRIVGALEALDPEHPFREDSWDREGGGGGRSRVLEGGAILEKAGVNVSCVFGELSESFAAQLPGEGRRFMATGVSLVLHPRNPHAPTVHANFRYLEKGDDAAWFGGGGDLTPWILYEEDARHFHGVWREVCNRHGVADHAAFKAECDRYFHIPHRGEARGIGGIFFDYMGLELPKGIPAELGEAESFVDDAAGSFLDSYLPILERRKSASATDEERDWQLVRRSRYVEFNLVYDRGTVFGLKTGGRTESILMSLPNKVRWRYDMHPRPDSYQSRLVEVLRNPVDWV